MLFLPKSWSTLIRKKKHPINLKQFKIKVMVGRKSHPFSKSRRKSCLLINNSKNLVLILRKTVSERMHANSCHKCSSLNTTGHNSHVFTGGRKKPPNFKTALSLFQHCFLQVIFKQMIKESNKILYPTLILWLKNTIFCLCRGFSRKSAF